MPSLCAEIRRATRRLVHRRLGVVGAMLKNRYASIDLHLINEVHTRVDTLVSRSAGDPAPFERQIDLWWFGVGIGVAQGRRTPMPPAINITKFHTGVVLDSDPWRIVHLELLALAEEGKKALENPSRVIRIASEYANTGTLWLSNELVGEAEPILALTNIISEFRTPVGS